MSALEIQYEKKPLVREWKARLGLVFAYKNGRTVLKSREHYGPLVVQRAFYPEGAVCHIYLIHPPGGVVGGDKLSIEAELQAGSHTVMTTPSAGKFYRSGELKGTQTQTLTVAEDSLLEWLPQENIFFDGCHSEIETNIRLAGDAKFFGWEINCLGRPAANEKFTQGTITQRISMYRDSRPIFLERNALHGSNEILYAEAGLKSRLVFATLLATHIDKDISEKLQEKWHQRIEKDISITLINDVLICRYLGDSADFVKRAFIEIWAEVRMKQKALTICKPRIWST